MRSRDPMRVACLLGALLMIGCGVGGSNGDGGGGTTGAGGQGGSTGAGGSGGTRPCSGMCANPITQAPNTASGDLGTGATCHEVAGEMGSFVCGNFAAPRTFTVNGTAFDCPTGAGGVLPAPRNGGWCFQAGPGDYSYAYFSTYNIQ